ncbi:hypothetical protein [Cucumibacter marinus]|uniref:hypothetical protein n=1 Tax=Cucumibacter marinus TaxID=1121252 RepID=UPI000423744B|nr:hypothetical protein [Cucumibacter marinus]
MSPLIVSTVLVPLGLGLCAGLVLLILPPRRLVWWAIAGLLAILVYVNSEGVPPFPPIASKQRLGYVIALAVLLAPLMSLTSRWIAAAVYVALSFIALYWLGGARLASPANWAPLAWLTPLPALFGLATAGFAGRAAQAGTAHTDAFYRFRLGTLVTAIGASILTLIGGFVGMAQLAGGLAAATGGLLIVTYSKSILGRSGPPELGPDAAARALSGTLTAIVLISALFTPTPSPLGFFLLALAPLAAQRVPVPAGLPAWARPFVFGLAAAIPVIGAVIAALLSSAG